MSTPAARVCSHALCICKWLGSMLEAQDALTKLPRVFTFREETEVTRSAQTDWLPPDDVTAHNSEPVDRTRDFFHPPPAEIGKVLTAHSTLVRGKEPYSLGGRLM